MADSKQAEYVNVHVNMNKILRREYTDHLQYLRTDQG